MKPSSEQLQHKTVLVVKIETTGTTRHDELLELCVLDARDPWQGGDRKKDPKPLFHARFRPEFLTDWPKASRINGITPAMAARERFLEEYRAELSWLFMNCDCVVAYNTEFVFSFLRRQFPFKAGVMTVDLMRDWTEHASAPADADGSRQDAPFLPLDDMFAHFDWARSKSAVDECLGLRHCFLKLIRLSAIHIRRPLQEKRLSAISVQQLAEAQEEFARAAAATGSGPYLHMAQSGENVEVSLGVSDPGHLLYAGEPPCLRVTVSGAGSASDVRERIANYLEYASVLPAGLRRLARDVLRGNLQREAEEKAGGREAAAGTAEAAATSRTFPDARGPEEDAAVTGPSGGSASGTKAPEAPAPGTKASETEGSGASAAAPVPQAPRTHAGEAAPADMEPSRASDPAPEAAAENAPARPADQASSGSRSAASGEEPGDSEIVEPERPIPTKRPARRLTAEELMYGIPDYGSDTDSQAEDQADRTDRAERPDAPSDEPAGSTGQPETE